MTTLLHRADTGEAVSVGTVVADPIPDGLVAVALSDADRSGLETGARRWNRVTRAMEDTPGWVDPAVAEGNEKTIRSRTGVALQTNAAYLALATPTAAQTTTQVKALTRQVSGLLRLVDNRLEAAD